MTQDTAIARSAEGGKKRIELAAAIRRIFATAAADVANCNVSKKQDKMSKRPQNNA